MIKLEIEKALDLIARVPDNQEFKEQLLKATVKAVSAVIVGPLDTREIF